ncbi:MAG: hypothetical protein CMJ48_11885 [Planctomycetaceae bacterium]|nr:hypothetical protein [Planctomycetaceae bacterium]
MCLAFRSSVTVWHWGFIVGSLFQIFNNATRTGPVGLLLRSPILELGDSYAVLRGWTFEAIGRC